MTDPVERRRELRQLLRSQRAALDGDEQAAHSLAVMARLARMPVVRDASVVAGYRAVRGEVDIDGALALLAEAGARVTLPRVVASHLEFAEWEPGTADAVGPFGIPEPTGDRTVPVQAHDVMLVPLVAFDGAGNRLGQGGGYYDRALASRTRGRPIAIGVAHAFQEVEALPTEPWDVALDAVVTEDEVHGFTFG